MAHFMEQVGNYVLELKTPRSMWGVRMAGDEEYISEHNTQKDARAAIKRYQTADRKRAA